MIGGRLLLVLSIGAIALVTGCLFDSGAYPNAGDGGTGLSISNGGGPGTGGTGATTASTGATGGATTSSSSTTSSTSSNTMSGMPCNGASECNDGNDCTTDDCVDDHCKYGNVAINTPVGQDDPSDCKLTVCNGAGSTMDVQDPGAMPDTDSSDCLDSHCVGTTLQNDLVTNGFACGQEPGPCQTRTCDNGSCNLNDEPDGTILVPGNQFACTDTICKSGGIDFQDNDGNCPDETVGDCYVPVCDGGSCGLQTAMDGTMCVGGTCNDGNCI